MHEERPCLWDIFHKSYHLTDQRDKAISEIGHELGAAAAEVKSKMLNLRMQLGRENAKRRKTSSGQATEELYKSSWIYWEHLQFLMPSLQTAKSNDIIQIEQDPFAMFVSEKLEELDQLSKLIADKMIRGVLFEIEVTMY